MHDILKGDCNEICLGYAHAILELDGLAEDGDEWTDVGPDSFTGNSIKWMRRDCIAFTHQLLDATGLAPDSLFEQEEPYDLGYEFFIARMGCPEFRRIDTGAVADALTRVGEEDFGEIAVELSRNNRIHYPRELPPIRPFERSVSGARARADGRCRIFEHGSSSDAAGIWRVRALP